MGFGNNPWSTLSYYVAVLTPSTHTRRVALATVIVAGVLGQTSLGEAQKSAPAQPAGDPKAGAQQPAPGGKPAPAKPQPDPKAAQGASAAQGKEGKTAPTPESKPPAGATPPAKPTPAPAPASPPPSSVKLPEGDTKALDAQLDSLLKTVAPSAPPPAAEKGKAKAGAPAAPAAALASPPPPAAAASPMKSTTQPASGAPTSPSSSPSPTTSPAPRPSSGPAARPPATPLPPPPPRAKPGSQSEDEEDPLAATTRKKRRRGQPESPVTDPDRVRTRYSVWKWVSLGAAVVLVGGGVVFGLRAGTQEEELRRLIPPNSTSPPTRIYDDGVQKLEEGWQTNHALSIAGFTAGVLTAGIAGVLFVLDHRAARRLAVSPAVGPHMAGISAQARF
jgi:hypothetical protein